METMISIGIGVISVCAIFVTLPQVINMFKYKRLEDRILELEQLTAHLRKEKNYILNHKEKVDNLAKENSDNSEI